MNWLIIVHWQINDEPENFLMSVAGEILEGGKLRVPIIAFDRVNHGTNQNQAICRDDTPEEIDIILAQTGKLMHPALRHVVRQIDICKVIQPVDAISDNAHF